jgi:hypothetical protein
MTFNTTILAGTALIALAAPAAAQEASQAQSSADPAPTAAPATPGEAQPLDEYGDSEEIVVQGQRARGSALGDIPPSTRSIPATSARPARPTSTNC